MSGPRAPHFLPSVFFSGFQLNSGVQTIGQGQEVYFHRGEATDKTHWDLRFNITLSSEADGPQSAMGVPSMFLYWNSQPTQLKSLVCCVSPPLGESRAVLTMCLQSLAQRRALSMLRWTVKPNNEQTKTPLALQCCDQWPIDKVSVFSKIPTYFLSNVSFLWPRRLLWREVQDLCNHLGTVRE